MIRTAEPDDAYELRRLYDSPVVRASLLDRRREIAYPTVDELREGLARPEKSGQLLAVEDPTGLVKGFCALRNAGQELAYGEIVLPLFDLDDYATPLAAEVLDYLLALAFRDRRMNKVLAHCLPEERAFRTLLVTRGFQSNGVQREVVWTQGRWHDLETLTRFHDGR